MRTSGRTQDLATQDITGQSVVFQRRRPGGLCFSGRTDDINLAKPGR